MSDVTYEMFKDSNGLLDEFIEQLLDYDERVALPWVLISSYCYYVLNETILSDKLFDRMMSKHVPSCRKKKIEFHHWYLIDEEAISAGSLFYLKDSEYPLIVKTCAHRAIEVLNRKGQQNDRQENSI